MLDKAGKVIYVGKAKNLKKRVTSYFKNQKALDPKTAHMIAQVHDIQITITRSEVEALLLEFQLIRELKPRYNILFRDDKSYPYIYISTQDQYPQLAYYRGDAKGAGEYYGPYPSGKAVRESIDLLQRTFQLRQCDNSYFKSRTRPCLQYQIKRCTAPCVRYVTPQDYAQDVRSVQLFLQGKTDEVVSRLAQQMDAASQQQDYEQAARVRDQITAMRTVQQQQIIDAPGAHGSRTHGTQQNVDVLGVAIIGRHACVHVLSIREGRMLGSRQFFPMAELHLANDAATVLQNFVVQYYTNLPPGNLFPREIILPLKLDDTDQIIAALAQVLHKELKITHKVRGDRARWVGMAQISAQEALRSRLAADAQLQQQFLELGRVLNINGSLKRIECFDVSHTQGGATVAACVVFEPSGALRTDYRRFNIKTAAAGDDYAAMEEALKRHFVRIQEQHGEVPDLLIIDGGKGQLARAAQVSKELALPGVKILGIAKGVTRKPGREKLYLAPDAQEISLPADSPALHLLQRVRDEAHRFAITGHRRQRGKRALHSVLEDIPGIGAARRRQLLQHFGGLQAVQCATVEEIAKVPTISTVMAKRIYDALQGK